MGNDTDSRRRDRRARERQRVREDIIDAALGVFARAGYHEAAVEDIAREAGYSTGALYNYFRNKQDLFVQLVERVFEQIRDRVGGVLAREDGFEVKLEALLTEIAAVTVDMAGVHAFLFDPQSHAGFASDELHEFMEREFWELLDRMGGLMQQGIDEGHLRDQPTFLAAHTFIGLASHYARGLVMARNEEEKLTPELYVEVVKIYFLHGAGTAPLSPGGAGQ